MKMATRPSGNVEEMRSLEVRMCSRDTTMINPGACLVADCLSVESVGYYGGADIEVSAH